MYINIYVYTNLYLYPKAYIAVHHIRMTSTVILEKFPEHAFRIPFLAASCSHGLTAPAMTWHADGNGIWSLEYHRCWA